MEGRGSRFPLLAAVCGIALVVLLAVSPVANAHCCVFCQCDFYCRGNTDHAPLIRLFKNGDHKYRCDLMHDIGGERLRVRVAYLDECALESPRKSGHPRYYHDIPCHHNLYTIGDDVASRTFKWGPVDNGEFLSNCIRIHIGNAQYSSGGNYDGKEESRSCVMVETGHSFLN